MYQTLFEKGVSVLDRSLLTVSNGIEKNKMAGNMSRLGANLTILPIILE